MNLSHPPPDDVFAYPGRARVFAALAELRRPASTAELARIVGRHPNTTRTQLQRLKAAGLVECRYVIRPRGRPRHEWAVAPGARAAQEASDARPQLAAWLARALRPGHTTLDDIEQAGREIGRELAPSGGAMTSVAAALNDALTALGFDPRLEEPEPRGSRHVLGNCPYRDAVRQNQPVVCTLHRGITRGLLDRMDPNASLADFVARDPDTAGCLIDVRLGSALPSR
jgi:predicted ArsR family transcriptional regulator